MCVEEEENWLVENLEKLESSSNDSVELEGLRGSGIYASIMKSAGNGFPNCRTVASQDSEIVLDEVMDETTHSN